jgi:hypothetical protein
MHVAAVFSFLDVRPRISRLQEKHTTCWPETHAVAPEEILILSTQKWAGAELRLENPKVSTRAWLGQAQADIGMVNRNQPPAWVPTGVWLDSATRVLQNVFVCVLPMKISKGGTAPGGVALEASTTASAVLSPL